jgi:iron complex transport system ATP-binding protein
VPVGPVVDVADARLVRDGVAVLDGITWAVHPGERWVVLGPNGSGKTSLLQLVTATAHPTSGTVEVLGRRVGRTDVRALRRRIAVVTGAITRSLHPGLTALEVVSTGRTAALAPWWDPPSAEVTEQARALVAGAGLPDGAGDRPFGVLSDGERQRVLLARMRLASAELWVFDEPAAGLDLGARERLVADLARLAADPATPPIVFVTHHVEEIPPGFTHALLLRQGRAVACGALADALTSASLSAAFDLELDLGVQDGRYSTRTRRKVGPPTDPPHPP